MGRNSITILLAVLIVCGLVTLPTTAALSAQNSSSAIGDESFYLFPYRFCAVLTVKEAHSKIGPGAWNNGQETTMTVQIDDVLRGGLPVGDILDISFQGPTENLFGGLEVANLKGRRLVLAFDSDQYSRPVRSTASEPWSLFEIRNLYAPFPKQQFTETDLQTLRQNLQRKLTDAQIESSKAVMESYIEARLTEKQLQGFCQPAMRALQSGPTGSSTDWVMPCSKEHPVITGILYPDAKKQLGHVEYCYDFRGGAPSSCFLRIERNKLDVWVIELPIKLGMYTTDDFTKYLLEYKLNNFLHSYWRVHSIRAHQYFGDGPVMAISKIVWSNKGKTVKFEGMRSTGLGLCDTLTANLNDNLDPSSFFVDGEPCPFWNRVCAEGTRNVDKVVHDDRSAQ